MTEPRTEQQTSDVPSSSVPSGRPYYQPPSQVGRPQPANLADILERILDKGIIIAGDIRVNLLDIELLTIKLRLLVVSVDKAEEMGIDWWKHDPMLTVRERGLDEENRQLRERLAELEGTSEDQDDGEVDAEDDDRSGTTGGRQSSGSRARG
jgi:Gas vesicle protein